MKKSLIFYTATLYILQALLITAGYWAIEGTKSMDADYSNVTKPLLILSAIAFVAVAVLGLVSIIICLNDCIVKREGNFLTPMIFKLVQIPFFVINFIMWLMLVGGMLNPFLFAFTVVVVPLGMFITFLFMLPTSLFNVALLVRKIKDKELTFKKCWWHFLLNCVFLFDVVDSVILVLQERKEKTN